MSTWLFFPSLLSSSTASRVVLDFILVLSLVYMTTFLFIVLANIRWDAALPMGVGRF